MKKSPQEAKGSAVAGGWNRFSIGASRVTVLSVKRFDEKVIFITGASSGIGAALARGFAKEGGRIVATARRAERLDELIQQIEGNGGEGMAIPCDVTRDGDLEGAVEKARERFGGIDVVVANAGFGVIGPFAKLSLEDFRRQFETNVFGVLRTVYATHGALRRSKGVLVLMGSVSSYVPTPYSSAYAMSKFSVRALADSLYAEWAGDGIAVTLVNPGFIESELRKKNKRGQYREDATDPIPRWLQMPTEKCAQKIVKATYRRKRELNITLHGKLFCLMKKYLNGVTQWAFRQMALRKGFPKSRT